LDVGVPHLLLNASQLDHAPRQTRSFDAFGELVDADRGEQPDEGHHDQQLGQRHAALESSVDARLCDLWMHSV
jgi:hypothetical protein